jgi:integrase
MAKQKPKEKTAPPEDAKYSVENYLAMLRLSKRSEQTIANYRKTIKSYADFIGVPLVEVHHHLSVSNLLKYADSRRGRSDSGTKTVLSILARYFKVNSIEFDELELNAVKPKVTPAMDDKPLELATLQKMMDLTDAHGRAILSFLVSTGCRAGEMCKIRVDDVSGDTVTIRNEIAKGGHGGKVYLTAEAREYLDLWLKERDNYIRIADARAKGLNKIRGIRPVNDQRLFAISYQSLQKIFTRLYDKVDGERGQYHARCTIHSCRKYFRTHAAEGMHPDLVTSLMRQTGYLDSTYVRMPEDERRAAFHKGEAALYLTRADHRIQGSRLNGLQKENEELRNRLTELENVVQLMAAGQGLTATNIRQQVQEYRDAGYAAGDKITVLSGAEAVDLVTGKLVGSKKKPVKKVVVEIK